jgi:hypothetical protein
LNNWRQTLSSKKESLTPTDYLQIAKRFGKNRGCSFGKDSKGFYCYTHRARSKSYISIDDIPEKEFKFIESTS